MTQGTAAYDVSHWQDPASVNYAGLRELHPDGFGLLVRLTYGSAQDADAAEHIRRARDGGAAWVSCYAFVRWSQSVAPQCDAFIRAARAVGYGSGDVIPWADLEPEPIVQGGQTIGHNYPTEERWRQIALPFMMRLDDAFGATCGAYFNRDSFIRMGRPVELRRRPAWLAHWDVATPDVDGIEGELHQFGVVRDARVYDLASTQQVDPIDANRVIGALPTIPIVGASEPFPSKDAVPAEISGEKPPNVRQALEMIFAAAMRGDW